MDNEVSHEEYYAQFGIHLIKLVENSIGKQRILESNDPYFNDIPLAEWNRLDVSVRQLVGRMIRECNGPKAGVSHPTAYARQNQRRVLLKLKPWRVKNAHNSRRK